MDSRSAEVSKHAQAARHDSTQRGAGRPVILAAGLVVSGRASRTTGQPVVNGADIAAHPGDIVVIDGPSGCGKTSLVWALARMLPSEGDLLLHGADRRAVPPQEWRMKVCLALQKAVMTAGSVRANLLLPFSFAWSRRLGRTAPDDDVVRREMAWVGLDRVDLDSQARELSGGEASRAAFVRAMLTNPDCLLLDEPEAHLDQASAQMLLERIRRYTDSGGSVILVRHGGLPIPGACYLKFADGRLSDAA